MKGMRGLEHPRDLAIAREIWTVREDVAAHDDISPGKILPNKVILAIASRRPANLAQLKRVPGAKNSRLAPGTWLDAIRRAENLPVSELPVPGEGELAHWRNTQGINTRLWKKRDPDSWNTWELIREDIRELSYEIAVPHENLISATSVKKITWDLTVTRNIRTEDDLEDALAAEGLREWQKDIIWPVFAELLPEG